MKNIEGADLFCGAGGTSEGMIRASNDLGIKLNLLAINHWQVAVNSHSLNHKNVRHKCESLETVKPRDQVPGGRLHILAASPECTDFSVAAGGKPKNDQRRANAWHITRWCSDLLIDNIFIENVREFMDWCPLLESGITWRGKYYKNGRPDPRLKGQTFKAFIRTLEGMGYRVEYRLQCAKEFGDPTSRTRLIILARRNGRAIKWPEPTHGPGLRPYRTAREVIDLSKKSRSIFNRPRPLSKNTLRRIEVGLKKFCGEHAQPFLIKLYGTNNSASIDEPLPTITAGGNHFGLVQPFLIHTNHEGGDRCHSIDAPMPTITGGHRGEMALVQPFLIGTTNSQNTNVHSIDKPMPTLTTAKGGEYALIQPFLTKYYGTGTAISIDEPLDTITTKDRFALVQPQDNGVDILLRMVDTEELQQAMSFPKDYKFYGTKEQAVKQIGNAVPVELARAHTIALLSE